MPMPGILAPCQALAHHVMPILQAQKCQELLLAWAQMPGIFINMGTNARYYYKHGTIYQAKRCQKGARHKCRTKCQAQLINKYYQYSCPCQVFVPMPMPMPNFCICAHTYVKFLCQCLCLCQSFLCPCPCLNFVGHGHEPGLQTPKVDLFYLI